MIPLILKIKKATHKEIARAQDIITEELYKIFNTAVIHGGTAIWRCYQGNRFSEDIDAYIPKSKNQINLFFENIEKRGFVIEKKKISENSVYSSMKFNRIYVRFEAIYKKVKSILKEYETADGNFITVYTLSPEGLINEKISAYMKRLKVRDLYDIFFLLRHVKDKKKINLQILIDNFKMPLDKEDLKVLILDGIVPTPEKMIEYIRWQAK